MRSELYIEECVNSLLNQSYSELEIILVDDGSIDGSGELMDSLPKIYPLRVVHKENGGAGSARNAGLEVASGEWIIFADSDDIYSENAIECLVNICEKNQCLIACCGTTVDKSKLSNRSFDQLEIKVYDRETGLQKLLEEEILSYLPCKIYHKSLFASDLRIPEGMSFEDLYIMPEIFARAQKIAETPEKLYYYHWDRPGNVSSSHSVEHIVNLSIAQRHRWELAYQLLELPERTKSLLLFRAIRSSLGAYRRIVFKYAEWKCECVKIVEFMKKYRKEILHCPKLAIPYKCIAFILALAVGE